MLGLLPKCVLTKMVWRKVFTKRQSRSQVTRCVDPKRTFPKIDLPEGLSGRQKIEYVLWWTWRNMPNPKPPAKEIKESIAFYHSCSRQIGNKKLLIDAAGGHGGIALVFRAFKRVERAVVADLFEPKSFAHLRAAWMPEDEDTSRAVKYQIQDVSETDWLGSLLQKEEVDPTDVVVVACHACSLLSDELIGECIKCQVEFAIMPCCQGEDSRRGKMFVNTAKLLDIPVGALIDVARLGVIDASPGYKAMMRCVDSQITPQNRVLIGLRETDSDVVRREADRAFKLQRLAIKYQHVAWRGEIDVES